MVRRNFIIGNLFIIVKFTLLTWSHRELYLSPPYKARKQGSSGYNWLMSNVITQAQVPRPPSEE